MSQKECLFNDDYLKLFNNKEKELLQDLATHHYIKDNDFEKYKDTLILACNFDIKKIREYMFKGFWKIGYYNKIQVPKIVCITKCSELIGEEWKPVKIWNQNEQKDTEYNNIQVSNYGRVREIKETEKYFEILTQYESSEKMERDKNIKSKNFIDGYLSVKLSKAVKIKNEYKSEVCVYKLVAEYWLDKPNDFDNCHYDIHHINNNGYENTLSNLIWLKSCQHKQIHPKFNMNLSDICQKCLEQKNK